MKCSGIAFICQISQACLVMSGTPTQLPFPLKQKSYKLFPGPMSRNCIRLSKQGEVIIGLGLYVETAGGEAAVIAFGHRRCRGAWVSPRGEMGLGRGRGDTYSLIYIIYIYTNVCEYTIYIYSCSEYDSQLLYNIFRTYCITFCFFVCENNEGPETTIIWFLKKQLLL